MIKIDFLITNNCCNINKRKIGVLDSYIDFKNMSAIDESYVGEYIIKKSDRNCISVVDKEIKNVDEKIIDDIFKFIKYASVLKYNLYDKKITSTIFFNKQFKSIAYKSIDVNYIVFCLKMFDEIDSNGYPYGQMYMLGIVNNETHKYLFLGTKWSHPYFCTNKLEYGNSDGSGATFKFNIDNILPNELFTHVYDSFALFASDKCH